MSQHQCCESDYAERIDSNEASMQYFGIAVLGIFSVMNLALLGLIVSGLFRRTRTHH